VIENPAFHQSLVAQTTAALTEGAERLLFWGYTPACIEVIMELRLRGFPPDCVVGIVDDRSTVKGRLVNAIRVLDPGEITDVLFDTVVITSNEKKEEALSRCAEAIRATPRLILAGLEHLEFHEPQFEDLVQTCLVKSYATGYRHSLVHLYQAIRYLAAKGVKGGVAEFGICKGGTVVFIQKALKKFGLSDATVYGFDIFDGFPTKKSLLDLYRHPKCEFRDYETVVNYCERFGVKVIKGDICETYVVLKGMPLILSFFDTDNYSPTRAALEMCADQTVSGGILFFDHFTTELDYLYTIGERMAAKEVLDCDRFFNPHGTGLFIKA
jgi:O-methyltransferase